MYSEHIEEMINLFKLSGTPLKPRDIATDVADNVCAQGLVNPVGEEAFQRLIDEIEPQVTYYFTAKELATAKRKGWIE